MSDPEAGLTATAEANGGITSTPLPPVETKNPTAEPVEKKKVAKDTVSYFSLFRYVENALTFFQISIFGPPDSCWFSALY